MSRHRCAETDCNLLALNETHCVAHRDYSDCASDEIVRDRCEDAPCCGCCDGGLM